MSSNSIQPSLYSSNGLNRSFNDSSRISSPSAKNLAIVFGEKSDKPNLDTIQRLSDGNKRDNDSSDEEYDDDDIVWDTVAPSAVVPVSKLTTSIVKEKSVPKIDEIDYMLYIIKKMVERHSEIASLCENDQFRHVGQKKSFSSSSSSGKRGRKRKKR